MGNAWFDSGLEAFAGGGVDWDSDTIKLTGIDLSDIGKAITGATNATPIVITSASHGFSNGDAVTISQVGGNTAANGKFRIANVTTNTFELTDYTTGANVAGNGAYTSGGYALNLTSNEDIADIASGARVATATLASAAILNGGFLDAANPTFSAVTGDPIDALLCWKDTTVEATSTLLFWIDSGTGLPVTPNGGDINITIPATGLARL